MSPRRTPGHACVVGGGSWGTAFAIHLGRLGIPTRLWIHEPDTLLAAIRDRENAAYLPGFVLPPAVHCSGDLRGTVAFGDVVFVAVPSRFCRKVYRSMAPALRGDQLVVSLTKGFDPRSAERMSELMTATVTRAGRPQIAVLSGPSFAREVAAGSPTAIVAAATRRQTAARLQQLVAGPALKVYTSTDPVGVEVGGAAKNVIAIAAGLGDALGLGRNARASLIARGLAEITRLGMALGARRDTFAGLAGIGDLVLTCTADQSRNYRVGHAIGQGRPLAEILAASPAVAEGVDSARLLKRLARRHGVAMPIAEQVHRVLHRGQPPEAAVHALMLRQAGAE